MQLFFLAVAFLVGHLFFRGQVRNGSILQRNRIVAILAQTDGQGSCKHLSFEQEKAQHEPTDP